MNNVDIVEIIENIKFLNNAGCLDGIKITPKGNYLFDKIVDPDDWQRLKDKYLPGKNVNELTENEAIQFINNILLDED